MFFSYISESYEQGLHRMNRACSEAIVHSSNLDERNSSEEEMNPFKLSGSELKESLDEICAFKENRIFSKNAVDKKSNDLIQYIRFINYFNTTKLIMYIIGYVQTKNKDSGTSPSSSLSYSKRKLSVSEDSASSNESSMLPFKSQKKLFPSSCVKIGIKLNYYY